MADEAPAKEPPETPTETKALTDGTVKRPAWQIFLESPGGTACISFILTGLIGAWITYTIQRSEKERDFQQQESAKEREFQQEWMKARGDQALIAYKDYLEQERETDKHVYELIGKCVTVSVDLIDLTGKNFDPKQYQPPGIVAQRTQMRKAYNDCDTQWRTERESLGLQMSYYHPGNKDVVNAWNDVQESVTNYMDCALKWYSDNRKPTDTEGACKDKKESLRAGISKLNEKIDAARQYAWEGWESPEKLRSALDKK